MFGIPDELAATAAARLSRSLYLGSSCRATAPSWTPQSVLSL